MSITWDEVKHLAIRFSKEWARAVSETGEKQTFWNEFFEVFGLKRRSVATFEEPVQKIRGSYGRIDLFWRGRLLVEHKSLGEDLGAAASQAFAYIGDLTAAGRSDEAPRYVIVSDFARFVLYDLEPEEQREFPLFRGIRYDTLEFPLAELHRHVRAFAFLRGERTVRLDPEDPANRKAYDLMCGLHDALEAGGLAGADLERTLVRILFCLFADDTNIFDQANAFQAFVEENTRADGSDLGARLNQLFDVLNTPRAKRPTHLGDDLAAFPYVNGALFAERLAFPCFTRAMREALVECCHFQWAKVSPAVFGSLFQGVMDDRERRQQGAHYTSERDILKVLRSLFLDDLRAELAAIRKDKSTRRDARLEEFHDRLRRLRFLDPACGCGNFLVLAYRELRQLELDTLLALHNSEQQVLDIDALIRVNVDQFHGIEIGEWPCRIAEVALWLMDHRMNLKAGEAFGHYYQRLPLRSSPHIACGNALRLDWRELLPPTDDVLVLGNPPFVGKHYQNAEQKADLRHVFGEFKNAGDLDYVTCWFRLAADYMKGTRVRTGFVATNSITQGEQVPVLWGLLFGHFGIKIHFGHRTFAWTSEARGRAHVHVVVIGFAAHDVPRKHIVDYEQDADKPSVVAVANISPYLTPGPDTFVTKRTHPLANVPEMRCGNKPSDGGHLILTDAEQTELLALEPGAKKYLRRFTGSEEFINGKMRWCLWMVDSDPQDIRQMPHVMERVARVREFRLRSSATPTREAAKTPTLFFYVSQPATRYILIPEVSSARRRYVPIGIVSPTLVSANTNFVLPTASRFIFGILTSSMHMQWLRTVGGRLKSDLRYSGSMVYNTFPWPPNADAGRKAAVEEAAQRVLDAREAHAGATLADLYDPLAMPADLAGAHAALDRAVDRCYRPAPFAGDRDRVEFLFALYEQITTPLAPTAPPRRRPRAPRP